MAHPHALKNIHTLLVQAIVDHLEKQGYRVTEASGLRGFREPTRTGRHAPDVKAYHPVTRRLAIGEAKRLEDITTQQSHEQFWDYANAFHKKDGVPIPCYFSVARHGLLAFQHELSVANADFRKEHVHILTVGVRDPSGDRLPISTKYKTLA